MEYDYTGALFYSAKNYHKRKDGKLIYYVANYFNGYEWAKIPEGFYA